MKVISRIGGARVGNLNVTFPFAMLKANSGKLLLSGLFIGEHLFAFDQIIKIEKVGWFPLFSWGIRIYHRVEDYPEKIFFWCFGSRTKLIKELGTVGTLKPENEKTVFEKLDETNEIEKKVYNEGLKVKTKYKVLGFILGNILMILEINHSMIQHNNFPSPFFLIGILGAFIIVSLINFNKKFRDIIMEDSRNYEKHK